MGQLPVDGQGLWTVPITAATSPIDMQAKTNITLGTLSVLGVGTATVTISDAVGGVTYTKPDGTVVPAIVIDTVAALAGESNEQEVLYNVPVGKWVRIASTNNGSLAIEGPMDVVAPVAAQGAVAGTGAPELGTGFMPPTPVQVPTSTH